MQRNTAREPLLQPLKREISSGDHYFLPSLLLRPPPHKPTFYTAQTEAFPLVCRFPAATLAHLASPVAIPPLRLVGTAR